SAFCPSGKCQRPPSCQGTGPGIDDCGDGGSGNQSCCTTLLVKGGTFKRSYDALVDVDDSHPATVSSFRFDKYEVTIGRFRQFVAAWVGGWRPGKGDGRHAHLNGGSGLLDSSQSTVTYESGWDSSWNATIAATKNNWDVALACDARASWSHDAGTHE